MFDDVKKGEKFGIRQKLNKKPSIKSKTINYEQLKKKQSKLQEINEWIKNLKNNIKNTMLYICSPWYIFWNFIYLDTS